MKKHVLVVDDQSDVAGVVIAFLQSWGYETSYAEDGEKALSALLEHSSDSDDLQPDCVITDTVMPRLNGIGLADRMQEMDCPTPIIFISGNAGLYSTTEMERFGGKFLAKPIDWDRLKKMLGQIFSATPATAVA